MNKLYYEEDLPFRIKEGKHIVDWKKSIGSKVRFEYNNIKGTLEIVDYLTKGNKVVIKYNDTLHTLQSGNLKKCRLKILFSKIFLYQIGDVIDNLVITERFFKFYSNSEIKFYKYICLKCGWDNGEISESQLKKGIRCSCCNGKTVVVGINDIPTTDSWMIPYFQGGEEEAKLYTKCSMKKIYPICPDCNRVKDREMTISNIYRNHGIGCSCSKSNSYPNKFIFKMLDQLQIKFEPEKVFDWAKFARYDFYFISPIDNKEYIIEADGDLGHGNYTYGGDEFSKIESLYYDYRKDIMAEIHNIKVIRIDCKKSYANYIKDNIFKSELKYLLNLDNINWEICGEFAEKNIVKEVCELYSDGKIVNEIYEIYNYICKETVRNYLHKGTEIGWCNYNAKQNQLNASRENGRKNAKEIVVFDSNKYYICTYRSITGFVENSNDIIGMKTDPKSISIACKTGKPYKGFYYKFKSDISESDYLAMIGEN